MITEIGVKFPIDEQFGAQEHRIYRVVKKQIQEKFKSGHNLLINLTWFGPQFGNQAWSSINRLINRQKTFDRIFWIGIVDPVTLLPQQLQDLENKLQIKEKFYIGTAFDSKHTFNTASIVCLEDFPPYTEADVGLQDVGLLYLNYNRKPKPHRIRMVEILHEHNLQQHGVISLGKHDASYDVSLGQKTNLHLTIEDATDYTHGGKFPQHKSFGGVPYDLCSLGNMNIWRSHFLNIVSETEFYPWDTVFPTEKTLKPIIGMRPFIINGQTTIYDWLRRQGFRTFNHYFDGVELENIPEYEVHNSIIAVIRYLTTLDKKEIIKIYSDMLPDLVHNRNRFFEYAQEQKYKTEHLFE